MLTELLLLVLLLCLIFLARSRTKSNLPETYPKGPPGWPLVGNLLQLGTQPHLKLTEWSRKYGAVYSLKQYKTSVIVLNSYKAFYEAMVDRKADFAGRPLDLVTLNLWTQSKDIVFRDYTKLLDYLRKSAHAALHLHGTQKWSEVITTQADKLNSRLAASNGKAIDITQPVAVAGFNTISAIAQGYTYDEDDQEFMDFIQSNNDILVKLAKVSILDYIPWLKPLFKSQIVDVQKAAEVRVKYMEKRLKERKETFNRLNPPHDVIDVMVMAQDKYQRSHTSESSSDVFDDTDLRESLMDFFSAGTETVVSTLRWFLVDMMLHPEVQKKIHEEMDDVIGNDRRPDYGDHEKLHYLTAALNETQRLHSTIHLGPLHRTLCSTSVDGYDIPGDTLVIPNLWAIDHDPDVFEDPHIFRPERFIDPESNKCVSYSEMRFAPFGLGKRECLGEMLARMEYFLLAANILHQFEVILPSDQEGHSIKGVTGLTHKPVPYKIVATKRDK